MTNKITHTYMWFHITPRLKGTLFVKAKIKPSKRAMLKNETLCAKFLSLKKKKRHVGKKNSINQPALFSIRGLFPQSSNLDFIH